VARRKRKRHGKPIAVDLFAGCGALSSGLARAGFRVAAAVEIDPKRSRTFSLNHTETKLFVCDIRDVEGRYILGATGTDREEIDLVAGCPPCQGFSRIRRRNGRKAVDDDRNDLVFEFGRLVREMRPRAVMMENVPGLEKDRRFKALLRSLRGAGYRIAWDILSLEQFGVPQRRRRLVMIGWRGGSRPDLDQIPTSRLRTVRDAIQELPVIPKAARALHGYKTFRKAIIRDRIKRVPHNGGSRRHLPESLRLECHKRETKNKGEAEGFKDVYGRMAWDSVAPTITGGCINPSKGRFLHPERDRAISLLEAARLQGFPIWYKFDISDGRYPIAEMIGEALPPRFAATAARFVARSLGTLESCK